MSKPGVLQSTESQRVRYDLATKQEVASVMSSSLDPMDCSSSVHGVLQARYWRELPCPPPGDLPHPGVKLVSLALEGGFFTTESLGKPGY